MKKLSSVAVIIAVFFLTLICLSSANASAEDAEPATDNNNHYVVIYDQSDKLSVKTDAVTVAEALDRADISLNEYDTVEPALDTIITSENFFINIHRAHPVVVVDGAVRKYIMTASYDPASIAADAGFPLYDGDEIQIETTNVERFLESGAATTYHITRNGGRTITVEETIPFTERTELDYSLGQGETKVTQVGTDGRRVTKYQVNFVDGVEVSRELISSEITVAPVEQVTAMGAKTSVAPGQETCASWIRQAGVSEADISAALSLIYHESGCRPTASNPSGAYGIPQAKPGNKMAKYGSDWQTNPVTQIRWMADYVTGRYGGWQQAMNHWWQRGWY